MPRLPPTPRTNLDPQSVNLRSVNGRSQVRERWISDPQAAHLRSSRRVAGGGFSDVWDTTPRGRNPGSTPPAPQLHTRGHSCTRVCRGSLVVFDGGPEGSHVLILEFDLVQHGLRPREVPLVGGRLQRLHRLAQRRPPDGLCRLQQLHRKLRHVGGVAAGHRLLNRFELRRHYVRCHLFGNLHEKLLVVSAPLQPARHALLMPFPILSTRIQFHDHRFQQGQCSVHISLSD
mmetsp:Transcript_32826/g.65871  ORF Transcript_32826/g.65871 Transcript_32826/m.65871 type:complete len:231 (+) Transcript_32826:66-758(+)